MGPRQGQGLRSRGLCSPRSENRTWKSSTVTDEAASPVWKEGRWGRRRLGRCPVRVVRCSVNW